VAGASCEAQVAPREGAKGKKEEKKSVHSIILAETIHKFIRGLKVLTVHKTLKTATKIKNK